MKAIIFGINGQDGYYMHQLLSAKQIEVTGISRSEGNWIRGSVSDFEFVQSLLKTIKPDYIFNFAARSATDHEALFENHATISTGTLNILESVRRFSPGSKVFLAGSALQFRNEGFPINEQSPFDAGSPYAVARIQSVYAGRYFRERFKMKVYTGYLFNHDSPLRSENHINQKIAKSVRRISRGSKEIIQIGDPGVKKEFGFAGDTMEAIWTLVNQENVFEAVIGTGKVYSIKDWLSVCFDLIGKNWEDYTVFKKDFVPEYKILVSNPQLINSLGWHPKTEYRKLAGMMVINC